MRKHFLLLFLMALLPMAGWAEDVTVTLFDFTVPYGTVVDVNSLPGDAVKVDATTATWNDIKEYLTFSSVSDGNVGTYEYTLTKAANTGGYTIFLSSNNAKMTIAKATTNEWTLDPIVAINTTYDAITEAGTPYALVATPGEADFGTPEYIVSDAEPAADAEWLTVSPTAQYAGVYKVWSRVEGTDNYVGIAPAVIGTVTITGTAITEYTAPQPIENLAYTSEAQDLISAGSATGGKMMYKVGDGEWSEDIPKGTAATTYTVYWMVKGDNTHSDLDGDNFNVAIGKGTPAITTVPALIAGFTYDASEHDIIGTAGVSTLSTAISYQLQKQTGAETWEAVEAATTDPATLKIKNAGVYRVVYSIAENDNVNEVAAVTTDPVTIAKADLTVSIKGCSKIYGADDPTFEITYSAFKGTEDKTVLTTQPVAGREAGEDVGYYALTFTTAAAAANYNIVAGTTNYLLINPKPITDAGVTITFGDAPVYDGTAKEANITEVKFFGDAKTLYNAETGAGDYTVSYDGTTNINVGNDAEVTITGKNNYTGSVVKKFSIVAAELYIIPTAASKTYGQADPTFAWTLKVGEETVPNTTLKGDVELARVPGENVGTYKIYVKSYTAGEGDNYAPANILNTPNSADAKNKTALFTINASTGNVLKLKFDPEIAAAKKTKVYDGLTSVDALGFSMDDLIYANEGLVGEDSWDIVKDNLGTPVFVLASKNAGETTLGVTGLGSPNYPTVEVEPLTFEVTKKELAVVVGDQNLDYGVSIASVEGAQWALATGFAYAGGESNTEAGIVLYTEQDINLYAPGSENVGAIKAKIEGTSNYKIAAEGNTWGKLTIAAADGLILTSADGDLEKISAFNDQAKNVKINFAARARTLGTKDRVWKANTWVTMTLPFNISVADLSHALGYAIVNVIDPDRTEINSTSSKFYGRLTMKGGNGSDDVLKANKPFMVKIADDIANVNGGLIDFGTQTIIAPASADDLSVDAGKGAKFTGTYTTTPVDCNNDAKFWFLMGNDDRWAYIPSTVDASIIWNILPCEGFIDMTNATASAAARNMTFYFEEIDGSTTAIKSISVDNVDSKQDAKGFYNLNGMKMDGAPVKKGIYIKDGKKVVIK